MNKEEIRLANIMLAEFMEVKVDDQGMGGYDWDDLEYRESWDWLMPVVDKIESLDFWVQIEHNDCIIHRVNHEDIREFGDNRRLKRETTYQAVVRFVKRLKIK